MPDRQPVHQVDRMKKHVRLPYTH